MLMPAAVLVLIVLGAIAVDFAVVFTAQRELANAAAAAANDAATKAVDRPEFYRSGTLRLDHTAAHRVARTAVDVRAAGYLDPVTVDVEIDAGPGVTVTATATVEYIFAKAIPNANHRATIRATARADARQQ
jgi:Flp pilus assembly protein TadG